MGCLPSLPVVSPPDRGYGAPWLASAFLQSGIPKFAAADLWPPLLPHFWHLTSATSLGWLRLVALSLFWRCFAFGPVRRYIFLLSGKGKPLHYTLDASRTDALQREVTRSWCHIMGLAERRAQGDASPSLVAPQRGRSAGRAPQAGLLHRRAALVEIYFLVITLPS